jgi:hypothetical protein
MRMDFNHHGFLGQEIETWRIKVIARHQAHFDFAYDVNDFCQRAKYGLNIHNKDGQEIIVASLFLKMLSDYQGAIILLERGLIAQGEEVLRCALEAFFLIKRAIEDDGFPVVWAKSDDLDRLRMLRSVGVGEGGLPPSIDAAQLEAKMSEVQRDIEQSHAKRIKITDIMQETEAQWLPSLYMIWSFPVHSTPRAVEKYVQSATPGEGIRGFNSAPSERGLNFALAWGAAVMLAVWAPLSKLFDLNVASEVDTFEARFRELLASEARHTST